LAPRISNELTSRISNALTSRIQIILNSALRIVFRIGNVDLDPGARKLTKTNNEPDLLLITFTYFAVFQALGKSIWDVYPGSDFFPSRINPYPDSQHLLIFHVKTRTKKVKRNTNYNRWRKDTTILIPPLTMYVMFNRPTCSCGFIFSACIFFTSPAKTASGSAVESIQLACTQNIFFLPKSKSLLSLPPHLTKRNVKRFQKRPNASIKRDEEILRDRTLA
jgi:hypothetical protein